MSTTRAKTALAALLHDSRMRRATDYGVACDVDAAGLLMSPETAAELETLRKRVAELEAARGTALAMHPKHRDSEHCQADGEPWPCATLIALGGAS